MCQACIADQPTYITHQFCCSDTSKFDLAVGKAGHDAELVPSTPSLNYQSYLH